MSKPDTYVYVIAVQGQPCVKVGVAGNPHKRLKQLQTASPFSLSLAWTTEPTTRLNALRCEAGVHFVMGAARLSGEWFRATPQVATAIAMGVDELVQKNAALDLATLATGFIGFEQAISEGGDTFSAFMALHALFEQRLR